MKKRLIDIYHHENYRSILREDFFIRSELNESYSLRAYAKDLDLSPSALSMVFQNKRHLSRKKLKEIWPKIGLDQNELEFVEALYVKEKSKNGELDLKTKENYLKHRPAYDFSNATTDERKTLTTSLIHTLVFNLFDIEYFRENPKKIIESLPLSSEKLESIVSDLVALKVISRDEGKITVVRDKLVLGNDSHDELLDHVKELKHFSYALLEKHNKVVDPENNVSIFYHLTLDEEGRQKTIDAIRKFQHEILNIAKTCKEPDQYFLLPLDFQKVLKSPY